MAVLFKIWGVKKLYDLSSGYLGDDHIGTYDGQIHVHSAECFLNDIENVLMREDRDGFSVQVVRIRVPDEKIWYKAGMH